MAVTTSNKTAAAAAPAPVAPPVQEDVHLELARVQRLMMGGVLYEKGKVYVFTAAQANRTLQQKDPQGIPLFTKAKPRTKLVEVPVELTQFATRAVESDDPLVPSGVRSLDLGEDDPELQERLAALDAAGEAPELVGSEVRVTV
jgi:hypothetical protein